MIKDVPNAIEEEKKVLSAMWLKDGEVIPTVAEILQADDFYRPEHKIIFAATLKVYETGHCDPLLVLDELKNTKVDSAYVLSLVNAEFSIHRAARYSAIIKEKAQLRRLIEISEELKENAEVGLLTVDKIIAKVDTSLQDVAKTRSEVATDIFDDLQAGLSQLEQRMKNKGDLIGVSTGFYDLDRVTNGLKKSDLIILAARPSMGKTALALNIAVAAARKVPTLLFSLEMSKAQIIDRLMASAARVHATRIAKGTLSDGEYLAIVDQLDDLSKLQFKTDDTGMLTLSELKMRARRIKQKYGLGFIVIDYIQLIQGDKRAQNNRVQEVSEISRSLKTLARDLDIPILALSQLNRSVELRAEKKPQLSDLRESGSLEQDADIVMFLYRDEYYNRDDTNNQNIADLIIAKNRNGATTTIKLKFEKEYLLFSDLVREG